MALIFGRDLISALYWLGVIAIIIGVTAMIAAIRSKGSTEILIDEFKGPGWFLLIIFGIVLLALGYI